MNAWLQYSEPFRQLAGWTMIHFLWIGALIALAGALVHLACRRAVPGIRYVIALTTLVTLAAAPATIAAWLAAHPESTYQPRALPGGTALAQALPGETTLVPPATSSSAQPDSPTLLGQSSPPTAAPPVIDLTQPATLVPITDHRSPITPQPSITDALFPITLILLPLIPHLPWLWLAGAPLTFTLLAAGLVGSRRLCRTSTPLTAGPAIEIFDRLRTGLRITRRVALAVCDQLSQPVLIGIIRPMILLPASALTGWTAEELEMVLLHELAHVRRWDNLVNLLQRIIESLLFFHPAVWLISRQVRRDREECCDATVIAHTRRPHEYAELLVSIAAMLRGGRPAPLAAASAMADHPLSGRIRRILNLQEEPMWITRRMLVVTIALPLLMAAATLYASADDENPPPSKGAEQPSTVASDDRAQGGSDQLAQTDSAEKTTTETTDTPTETPEWYGPTGTQRREAAGEQLGVVGNSGDNNMVARAYKTFDRDRIDLRRWMELVGRPGVSTGWDRDGNVLIVSAPREVSDEIARLLEESRRQPATSTARLSVTPQSTPPAATSSPPPNRSPKAAKAEEHTFTAGTELKTIQSLVEKLQRSGKEISIQKNPDGTTSVLAIDRSLPVPTATWTPPPAQQPSATSDFRVFDLKYARASLVTLNLEEYFANEKERVGADQPMPRFIMDPDSNTIVVQNASGSQLETITKLVQIYDVPAAAKSSRPVEVKSGQRVVQSSNASRTAPNAPGSSTNSPSLELSPPPLQPSPSIEKPTTSTAAPKPNGEKPTAKRLLAPGDLVRLQVIGAFPDQPITDIQRIEPEGTLPLGVSYGRVKIAGQTVLEAEAAIKEHLKRTLTNVDVQLTLWEPQPSPPAVSNNRPRAGSSPTPANSTSRTNSPPTAVDWFGQGPGDASTTPIYWWQSAEPPTESPPTPANNSPAAGSASTPTNPSAEAPAEASSKRVFYSQPDEPSGKDPRSFYFYSDNTPKTAAGVHWQTDLDAAKRQAAEAGKPILAYFDTPTDVPGREFEKSILNSGEVTAAINATFVPVKINVDASPAAAKTFNIDRVPMTLVLSLDGRVIKTIPGVRNSEEFLEHLATVPIPSKPPRPQAAATQPANAHLYDGKTFYDWAERWKFDLKTENRIEAIRALDAFARAGMSAEAAQVILEIANQYDFGGNVSAAEKALSQAVIDSVSRMPAGSWMPIVLERLKSSKGRDLDRWQEYAHGLLRSAVDTSPEAQQLAVELAKVHPKELLGSVAKFLIRGDNELKNPETVQVVRAALSTESPNPDLLFSLGFRQLDKVPEQMSLLLHKTPALQYQARWALAQYSPQQRVDVVAPLREIVNDPARREDRLAAIRALSALAQNIAKFNRTEAKAIVRELEQALRDGDPETQIAALAAMSRISARSYTTIIPELVQRDDFAPELKLALRSMDDQAISDELNLPNQNKPPN